MIDDGTAVAAWNYDETVPFDIESLSFAEAKGMLSAGRQVRRLLGVHWLEDRPPFASPQDDELAELREREFEARARRGRSRCGRVA